MSAIHLASIQYPYTEITSGKIKLLLFKIKAAIVFYEKMYRSKETNIKSQHIYAGMQKKKKVCQPEEQQNVTPCIFKYVMDACYILGLD